MPGILPVRYKRATFQLFRAVIGPYQVILRARMALVETLTATSDFFPLIGFLTSGLNSLQFRPMMRQQNPGLPEYHLERLSVRRT